MRPIYSPSDGLNDVVQQNRGSHITSNDVRSSSVDQSEGVGEGKLCTFIAQIMSPSRQLSHGRGASSRACNHALVMFR